MVDRDGNVVAKYVHDSWGKLISTTGTAAIGSLNPFRYRGYIYDTETGLYYLKTRYYDPEVGRFINADVLMSTGQGVIGCNMFCYCLNNPVNMVDKSGCYAFRTNSVMMADSGGRSYYYGSSIYIGGSNCDSFYQRYLDSGLYQDDCFMYSGGAIHSSFFIEKMDERYNPPSNAEYVLKGVRDLIVHEAYAICAEYFLSLTGPLYYVAKGAIAAGEIVETAKKLSMSRPNNVCDVYRVTISNTYSTNYAYASATRYYSNNIVLYYGIEAKTNNIFYLPDY